MNFEKFINSYPNYSYQQVNGQRILRHITDSEKVLPGKGCEIIVENIPPTFFENQMFTSFSGCGEIFEMRLMTTVEDRLIAFIKYYTKSAAKLAVLLFDEKPVEGETLRVEMSIELCELEFSGISSSVDIIAISNTFFDLFEDIKEVRPTMLGEDVQSVIVEFNNHQAAAAARRKFIQEKSIFLGRCVSVAWAGKQNHQDAVERNSLEMEKSMELCELEFSGFPNVICVPAISDLICSEFDEVEDVRLLRIDIDEDHQSVIVTFANHRAAAIALRKFVQQGQLYWDSWVTAAWFKKDEKQEMSEDERAQKEQSFLEMSSLEPPMNMTNPC